MQIKTQSFVFVLFMSIVLASTAVSAAEMSSAAIPVCFIQNNGQADDQALFFAEAPGYSLYLTSDGQILSTADAGAVVSITYPGAGTAIVYGEDVLEGKANFFIGDVEEEWVTDVPMYSSVRYEALFEGITLLYRGGNGILKREFIVEPGADPSVIQMKYAGQDSLVLDGTGAIMIETPAGTLIETAPLCYQVVEGKQVEVSCGYVISGDTVTFSIGSYDPALPLIIDPVIDFSTYFGGTEEEEGAGIGLDDAGNIYIVGSTKSVNLPLPNAPIYQEHLNGSWDIFVAKMSPDGSQLIYSTYIGGNQVDMAGGIAVNNATEQVFITGYTLSNDYPETLGVTQKENLSDVVVTGLDQYGSGLLWSRYFAGNRSEQGTAIVYDASGNPVVVGFTNSNETAFPGITFYNNQSGNYDAFIVVFDVTTGLYMYSPSFLGGTGADYAYGIDVDSAGNFWVTGSTGSMLFPTTTGAFRQTNQGKTDVFITKFLPTLGAPDVSTYLGGSSDDFGRGIALDFYDYPYVTGYTESPVSPISLFPIKPLNQAFQTTYGGGNYDAFVTKMEADLSAINYSTYLGGNYEDRGYAIAVDNMSRAYVTGFTISENFPTKYPIQAARDGLVSEVFITELNETGTGLLFSSYLGGSYYDEGNAIAITSDGLNITLTGYTESFNFPIQNAYQPYLAGFPPVRNPDAFITKIVKLPPVVDFYGEPLSGCSPLTVNFTDNSSNTPFPVTGWFWDFGDGKNSTEQNPVHVYYRNGTTSRRYNVTLTATNQDGSASLTKIRYIRVCPSIEANFSTNKTNGCIGSNSTIRFLNWTVGNPDQLFWDFGDGTNATTNATVNPVGINHKYLEPGLYTVSLTATFDCCNNTTVKTDLIDIRAVPVADFNATPTSGLFPLDVSFLDNSTGRPSNWTWLFGAGQGGSNEQNPEHTYLTKGHYTVRLQACNFCGCDWENRTAYIKVGDPNLSFAAGSTMVLPNGTIIVPTNDTTPLNLFLQETENGLSGYDLFVFFGDTEAGNITPPVKFPAWAANKSAGPLPAPNVTIKAVDMFDQVNPGATNVLLASLNLTGLEPMVMWFNVTPNELDDDFGNPISTNNIPANIKIVRLLPFPNKVNAPKDPFGNQMYWDVNGNGNIDFNDVTTYFQNMQWIRDNQYVPFFDYNGNGLVDFNDLILLFQQV